jgi:S-(hydroxymethyl)glutathione dehydrogenase / alcohol dehydrogenase
MPLIQAAVLTEINKPLELKTFSSGVLKKGQVLIKIHFSGICRSQLMEIKGMRGHDKWLPHMLGHEASGTVIEIGKGVKKVKEGDEVILSWIKSEGIEAEKIQFEADCGIINAGPISTFSNYSIISENRLVHKPKELSMKEAMLFGCAIPTGAGIVINQAKPNPSNSLLILGMGGIGFSAFIMAIALGIKNLTVIDINDSKLAIAKKLGAEFIYNAKKKDLRRSVIKDLKEGYDFCVESAGLTSTIELGFDLINKDHGQLFFASHPPKNEKISLDPHELISGKKIFGSWGGDVKPDTDIPFIWDLIRKKETKLSNFIQKEYSLENINSALSDLEKGKALRPLITMEH